jgi:phosphatidylglycerol:prolipoprotein diacylglycerol transferase
VQFPVYIPLAGYRLHPHLVMECIAYIVGFTLQTILRVRHPLENRLDPKTKRGLERHLWLAVGALFGALAGAKLLAWIENAEQLAAATRIVGIEAWLGGKTIVGGLAGGWLGVEIAKKLTGIRDRTGDLWVYPLCFSIAIGRVGCFLTGLSDNTYGNPTRLPWGVDFGDGIPRHPTQLYEIIFLLLLAFALFIYQNAAHLDYFSGRLFRWFILSYSGWRFLIEFIKPTDKRYLGLSAIQIVSAALAIIAAWQLWRDYAARAKQRGTAAPRNVIVYTPLPSHAASPPQPTGASHG